MKPVVAVIVLGVVLIALISGFSGCVGRNDFQTYQIKQGINGTVDVIDDSGWYSRGFATVYTYPRSVQVFYSESPKEGTTEDESIVVHFNDGGTAKISVMAQYQLPTDAEKRKHLHQTFGNVEAVNQAVRAHLINCVKNTGPMMSATENQAARKGEFNQVVEEQLRKGIYAMRRVEVELKDKPSATTQPVGAPIAAPIKVWATEIVTDIKTGAPIIVEKSALEEYGIVIQQFSITGTNYDDATKAQFAAKQGSFLAAEKSKAQREAEVQQTLMVEQKGLREKAEIEAAENVKKQQLVIQAQTKAEVAEQEKIQAETVAAQALSVAKLTKETAEMKASQDLEVKRIAAEAEATAIKTQAQGVAAAAQIKSQQDVLVSELKAKQAEQEAKAIEVLAKAEQQKIALSGALSEKDRLLMELDSKTKIGVADAISKINVPATIIGGNAGESKGNVTESLMNMTLLRALNIIPPQTAPNKVPVTTTGN